METEDTGDKAEQMLREIIHYSTMIEKIIDSKLEEKSEEIRNTPSEGRLDDDKLR